MTKLSNPTPIFYDAAGNLLDGGNIYIGVANADPQTQPINLFWDYAQTIPAAQPLRVISGRVVNGATPANVFFAENDFSLRSLDSNGAQVDYSATVYQNLNSFQPKDADLTAIADAGTTPFGVSLLQVANADALKQLVGTASALQKAGGAMTGYIYRQGAGPFIHWADPSYTGDTAYVTDSNGNDPTVSVGDLWIKLQ